MFHLHIGLKKSGSASIQTFLSENQPALRELSADYTASGRGKRKAHHNLAHDAMGNAKFDPSTGGLDDLARVGMNAEFKHILVSSEMFEGCEASHVARIRSRLAPAAREFRIVLILRDLLDLIPSSYGQKIRYGLNLYDFDTFFDERMRETRVDYFQTANRWADVFGWDALRVRPLDSRFLKNGDLIDDFLDTVGIDILSPEVGNLKRAGVVNAAGGWKTLEAIRGLHAGRHGLPSGHPLERCLSGARVRRQGKEIEEIARAIGEDLGWNAERGEYFTRQQAERVSEIYAQAIQALNRRLSSDLPAPLTLEERGFVGRPFLPDVSRIHAQELRVFYDELAVRLTGAPAVVEVKAEHEFVEPSEDVSLDREALRAARRAERKAERVRLRTGI